MEKTFYIYTDYRRPLYADTDTQRNYLRVGNTLYMPILGGGGAPVPGRDPISTLGPSALITSA